MRRSLIGFMIAFLVAWPFVRIHAQETEGGDDRSGVVENDREERSVVPSTPVVQPSPSVIQPQTSPVQSQTQDAVPADTSATTATSVSDSTPVLVTAATDNQQSQTSIKKPTPWPWYITRAVGIASYLLLFLLSVTGMLMTTGLLYRVMSPAAAWSFHRTVGVFLILSILTHMGALLFDRFINLRLIDILIPFVSPFKPILVALGIGGLYLFVPVILSSLAWVDSRAKFWRTVHALSFPMFLMIFLHGVLLGTDTRQIWMQDIYWSTGSIIGLLVLYRLVWKWRPVQTTAS